MRSCPSGTLELSLAAGSEVTWEAAEDGSFAFADELRFQLQGWLAGIKQSLSVLPFCSDQIASPELLLLGCDSVVVRFV